MGRFYAELMFDDQVADEIVSDDIYKIERWVHECHPVVVDDERYGNDVTDFVHGRIRWGLVAER